ncbi:hypothetical protein [Streptomyces nojiriensis]|uniref:hypothetical protein n=1 Tax=Streptomyces nojiriensis TaxID=66374 RepID=UPI00368D55DE
MSSRPVVKGAVEALCRAGEFGRALKVVEPLVATGWPTALWARAPTSRSGRDGRLDDTIAVAEPGYDCSNLPAPLVYALLDRPGELLYLVEHPSVVPHHDHEELQHWWRALAPRSRCRAAGPRHDQGT